VGTALDMEIALIGRMAGDGVDLELRRGGQAVTNVEAGGPAEEIGLERGDVIVQMGRQRPTDMGDLGELLEEVEAGQKVSLVVLRAGRGVIYRASVAISAR
jgi:putative serine protease PepD